MRISDWSSDVCSSDLSPTAGWETESRAFRAAGSADLPPRWADFADTMDALGARFRQRMEASRPDRERGAADPLGRAASMVRVCPSVLFSLVSVSLKYKLSFLIISYFLYCLIFF